MIRQLMKLLYSHRQKIVDLQKRLSRVDDKDPEIKKIAIDIKGVIKDIDKILKELEA